MRKPVQIAKHFNSESGLAMSQIEYWLAITSKAIETAQELRRSQLKLKSS
jgi:hypothetical protein